MRQEVPKGRITPTSGGKRFTVSDVGNASVQQINTKDNDEKRRLVIDLDDRFDDIEQKIGDVAAKTSPGTGGGTNPSSPQIPPTPPVVRIKTSHNGTNVVVDTREIDFVDNTSRGGVLWTISNAGGGHATVRGQVVIPDYVKLSTDVQGECGLDPVQYISVARENDGLRFKHSCLAPCAAPLDANYIDYSWDLESTVVSGKVYTDVKLTILNQNFAIAYDADGFAKAGQSVNPYRGLKFHDSAHITLTLAESTVTCFKAANITPALLYTAYIGENVGGYVPIYKETVAGTPSHKHRFKTIKAGTNITINEFADYIEIVSSGTVDVDVTGANVGAGTYAIYKNTTSVGDHFTLNFKKLENTHDAFYYESADVIYLDVDIHPNNLGGGTGLFYDKTHVGRQTFLNFKSIVGGTGISISSTTTEVTISSTVVDTNDTYSVNNLGAGANVYKTVTTTGSSHVFKLRTLKSSDSSVNITEGVDEIDFTVTPPDPYSLTVYGENYSTPNTWSSNVNDVTTLRFSNLYNRVGLSQDIDEFDTFWTIDAYPGAADARIKNTTHNPIKFQHRTTGGVVDSVTNRGQRTFAFRDTSTVTFAVNEDTDADGWRRSTITATVSAGAGSNTYTGANLGGELGEPYISTTGTTPTFTHNFRTIGGYDTTINVYQVGNTILLQANLGMVAATNVGGFSEVYKDTVDTGLTLRTFRFRTIQSSDGTVVITQNANDIDLKVTDNSSVKSYVEFGGMVDNYNLVSNPMRELRFSHLFNRPGFTVAPNDFDSIWQVIENPSSGKTRAKMQIPNPMQGERRNIVSAVVNTTSVGIRKFIFQDNSQVTFSVAEGVNADGYRHAIVSATFTNAAVVERIYDMDNIGGFREVYKNYTDSGSTRTFHVRTLQSSDSSITITQNSENIDFTLPPAQLYDVDNVGGFNQVYKNYTDSGGTRTFHMRTLQSSDNSITITQNTNDIDFVAPDTYDLSVGYGGFTGPTLNFTGATMGVVNSVDTHLLWFAGDNAQYDGTAPQLGLNGSKPTFDVVFLVDNNDAPWVVGNPYHGLAQTTRIKARVTPLLHLWDYQTQDVDLISTTENTTRIEFKDTATIQARVLPHATLDYAVQIELTSKEGTSVQNIRVRQNSTGTGASHPRINLTDTDYTVWTVGDDVVNNEHDISVQPKIGFKLNAGSLAYRKDLKFITGTGVTLTEDTTNADEYRVTIARPLTIKNNGTTVVAGVTDTLSFDNEVNDITAIATIDPDPERANVKMQFCGYGTKWAKPYFCKPGGVDVTMVLASATWSHPIWFDNELTDDTRAWVNNPTSPAPKWEFKPDRKARYHVHVFLRFRSTKPEAPTEIQSLDLPQLAIFKNGVMDTMIAVDEGSVRYNQFYAYATAEQGFGKEFVFPMSSFSLYGGTTMQLEVNDAIDVRLLHQTGADRYLELLYGWITVDFVGRCNDTLALPSAVTFIDYV